MRVRLRLGKWVLRSAHSTENARDATNLTAAGATVLVLPGPASIQWHSAQLVGWSAGVETSVPHLRHVAPCQSTRQVSVIYHRLRPFIIRRVGGQ